MKKIISFMCIFGAIGSAESVQMTPQIQRLLEEKRAKVEELEKCDSKRKGFVIAGVSTLGLTAVGIGGNIALANTNKKLDAELDSKKTELADKQKELISLQNQRLQEQLAQQLEQQKQACNAKGAPYQWTTNGECRIVYDAEKAIAVLKAKNDTHNVTKQKFCSLKGKASEFEYFVNQDDYNNVYMQDNFWDAINYAAGLGAWCVYAKADWQVVVQGNGWRCSCKNIPDIVCNSDIETIKQKKDLMIEQPDTEIKPRRTATDWSVLDGDDRPYDVTKEDFCKEAIKGSIKGTIAPSLSDASFLFAQQRAVGYRYWCSLLKGKWSISEGENGAKVWACQNIPESACKVMDPLTQKEKLIVGNEMMEENDLFLSSEQVVKKPDNRLCTDSGGTYMFGKCKCPNDKSKLSSDGKSCECINNTVFNEKTKRCEKTINDGEKGQKKEKEEKNDADAPKGEKPNKLCTESGGVYAFGKCKCPNNNSKLSSDGKSCECINNTVFNEKIKRCEKTINDGEKGQKKEKEEKKQERQEMQPKESAQPQQQKASLKTEESVMTDSQIFEILQNTDNNAHGVTKEEFCKHASSGSVGQSISKSNFGNNQARLQAMVDWGLGHGYWCNKFDANWTVSYNGLGWYWSCSGVSRDKCSDNVSKETVQNSETKDAFADMEAKIKQDQEAFERENQALANGTAEGYIYFLVKDNKGNVIQNSYIDCHYTIDDGAGGRYSGSRSGDCNIGTWYQGNKCMVQDLPDEATCSISSSGYKSKQVTGRDLKSGVIILSRN